jgi:hypothetical protein
MSNKKRFTTALFIGIFSIVAFVQVAAAQDEIPAICEESPGSLVYDLGKTKGENIVDMAWNRIDHNCDEILDEDDFNELILGIVAGLELPDDASDYVICHYWGFITGIADYLEDLNEFCVDICVTDGSFIGEIAAIMYCELSKALGGLSSASDLVEGILSVCEEIMVDACKDTFEEVSTGDAECVEYTESPHDAVWEQAKNNQCVFNPVP